MKRKKNIRQSRPKTVKEQTKKLHPITENTFAFSDRIESILEVAPIISSNLMTHTDWNFFQLEKLLSENTKRHHNKTNNRYFETDNFLIYSKVFDLKDKISQLSYQSRNIYETLFINVVSQAEIFFKHITSLLYYIYPDYCLNIDGKIPHRNLFKYNDIDVLKKDIIHQETVAIFHKSPLEVFEKILLDKNNIDITKLPIWIKCIEAIERRNSIVHNDGIVNQKYINICLEHNCDIHSLKIGEKLSITKDYLQSSCYAFLEMGYNVAIMLFQKYEENKYDILSHINLRMLINVNKGRYLFSESFYKNIFLNTKIIFNEEFENIYKLNYAMSLKFLNKQNEMKNIIEDLVDYNEPIFNMCRHLLKDEFERASEYMIQVKNVFKRENYFQWPIFQYFIRTDIFKKSYLEIYKKTHFELNEKNETSDLKSETSFFRFFFDDKNLELTQIEIEAMKKVLNRLLK